MRRINRRKFIIRLGEAAPFAALGLFLLSDKHSVARNDVSATDGGETVLRPDEREILYLASLAPSGHNTQPWRVDYLEPFHWIVGNEPSRWLSAVDPAQRETVLSIGAFAQNLDHAAAHFGYSTDWKLIGAGNQDERLLEVRLARADTTDFDIERIRNRRTLRGAFRNDPIAAEDLAFILEDERAGIHYFAPETDASRWLGENTLAANRTQAYRDEAQHELSEWVRFSSREAARYRDGLTTASMEIDGVAGWMVRNLYIRENVLSRDFRERGIEKVAAQVAAHGGWIVITSPDSSTASLIDAGRRMERIFLKVRERNIGFHPMTQVLEEESTRVAVNEALGIPEPIQFIIRTGYANGYPAPVSMRRPAEWFVRG